MPDRMTSVRLANRPSATSTSISPSSAAGRLTQTFSVSICAPSGIQPDTDRNLVPAQGTNCDHAGMPTKAPVAPEDVARRTLRVLIERLHPAVLDVLVAPVGLDREVGDPVILDPADESLPPAHSIVLAVGVDSPRAQAALLDRMVDANVAAVVLKHAGAVSDAVTDVAQAAEVAVLSAPPALSWGQLYSFLLTATRAPSVNSPHQPEAPLGDPFGVAAA